MISKEVHNDLGLLILRVFTGIMLIAGHGWSKLAGFSMAMTSFPDPLGIGAQASLAGAVFTEVFCQIFIILGIKTRWFSVPSAFTMVVAAFMFHGNDPWANKEKALLYLLSYIVLFISDGGKFSLKK